jgi:exopolysaccharide production protein ExoZ
MGSLHGKRALSIVELDELVHEQPVPAPDRGQAKLMHLQILRGIAASLVVFDHSLASLRNLGFPAKSYVNPAFLSGDLGVDAFFVLSGLIMVRQSSRLFGSGGAHIFAYRRITRIVPLYWFALFVQIAIAFGLHMPPRRQLLLSLAFVPNYLSNQLHFMPLLQVGWTLNYEMFFYLLFALALTLPRRRGLICLLLTIELLIAIGRVGYVPAGRVACAMMLFYTDPMLRLFSYGVVIGFFESEVKFRPAIRLPIPPALLLLVPPLVVVCFPASVGAWNLYPVLAVYAVAVVLLCTLLPSEATGRVNRLLVVLGDASYSTYLFHLFSNMAVFWVAAKLLRDTARRMPLGVPIVAMCLISANVFGLLVHMAIERPFIRAFRKISQGADA